MTAKTERRPPLDVAAAAQYLGTSERHVRRLVFEKKVPHFHLGGKLKFLPDKLDAWLDSQHVGPEA